MATTFTEAPPMQPAQTSDREQVDLVLEDRLPEHLRLSRGAMLLVVALSVFFWRLSTRPLFHSDLWGHLSYGRWIWEHRALPATEPFMPLAKGVPLVDSAWLSQLLGFGMYTLAGPAGLQFVMGICVTGMLALLAYALYHKTHSAWIAAFGMGACLWLAAQQLVVGWGEMPMLIRPQISGVLIYAWFFLRAVHRPPSRAYWILVPVATCLWANLHGSFVMGPLMLTVLSIGRGLDLLRRTGTWRAVWRDKRATHWFMLLELSVVAALINPYGIGLYTEVLTFTRHLNIADLLDWEPLTLRSTQGRAVATVACLLMVLYRLSPRRVSVSEFLLLAGFGGWTLWTSRMLIWWSIPAAYFAALHLNAVLKRRTRNVPVVLPRRTSLCSVAAVGAAWICFALSPFGIWVVHHKPQPLKGAVSADTPLGAVEYLSKMKEPIRGQIFNSYEWGDYLVWAGPRNVPIFVDSHVHVIPREVWQSYLMISRAASNWDDQLEKYGVNYVVIDHRQLPALNNQLKGDEKWRLAYRDGIASIFIRKKPI